MSRKISDEYQIVFFNSNFYTYNTDKRCWEYCPANNMTAQQQKLWFRRYIQIMGDFDELPKAKEFDSIMAEILYYGEYDKKEIDRENIYFTNGVYNPRTATFQAYANASYIPSFTPFQIKHKYIEDTSVIPQEKRDLVDRFFEEVSCGDEEFQDCLFEIIGAAMAPQNKSIFPILKSNHSTSGKGTFIEILRSITGLTRQIQGDQWWGKSNQFSLAPLKNQLVGYVDEVPDQMPASSSEKIKAFADSKQYLEIERKGVDQEEILNTPLLLATTNHDVNFHGVDDALKRRVIWLEFNMNADGKSKFSQQEINTLTQDRECLQYIINKAMTGLVMITVDGAERNSGFSLPKCHYDFWDQVDFISKSREIIESNQVLSDLIAAKATFIANEDINTAVENFKQDNKEEKITAQGFKKDFMTNFYAKRLGTVKIGSKSINGKAKRGLVIEWNGEDNE